MSLLHPALLYGLMLAAVPVVLHLLMRSRPKKIDFPALRLLENIRKQNSQRMRLRHIGLLLLRMLVLILLVLAVARPTLPAANYGLASAEWGMLAVVLLLAAAIYWAGRKYWVHRASQKNHQMLRQSWLRAGTVVVALLLMLLLVGWPYQKRVYSEIRNPGEQLRLNVPVAAVFLFDVSASMGYQHENRHRLDQARELALSQVKSFPSGSRVAITDNANTELKQIKFLKDLRTATSRLQRSDALQPRDASLLLNDRVLSAIQLQSDERQKILKQGESESSDRFLREIYIYTDRARSAWSLETASRLKEEMEQVPWLRCYILDVGVETATNFSLNNLALSQATVIQGGLVTISADVTNQSLHASECVAELYLGDSNGSAVKRDQVALTLEANQTGQASFTITTDTLGVLQGEIRIAQSDPLKIDNTAAFSLMVKPRPNVLIVAEKRNEAFVWEQALAPSQLVKRGVHQYTVKVITPSRLRAELELGQANSQTKRPDVVYLMNVSRLSEKSWNSLQNYVQSGGGLGVFLGSTRIEVKNYRNLGQADWLAALPSVHVRPPSLKKIEVVQGDHPVFSYLEKLDVLGLYSSAAVRRYWKTELPEGASVLANFSDEDRSAAVVARNYGRGRVLSVSTGVDLSGASEQRNWSDLARLDWIYAAWADQVTKYLQGGRNLRLNRTVGSPVVLTVSEDAQGKEALLQLPGLRQEKITIPFQGTLLKISSSGDPTSALVENRKPKRNRRVAADRVGSYRILFPAGSINPFGFSLQLADQETDLQPLSYAELDELFGVDRWQLSRTYEELERSVILGRIGTEAYPLLIILLIIIFLGEHLAANLFYGRQDG